MNSTWIIICSGLIILLIGLCAYWYFKCYRNYRSGCTEKLSMSKFLKLYENADWKWVLHEGYVTYYPNGTFLGMCNSKFFSFYFTILDTFRYNHWYSARKNEDASYKKKILMNALEESWNNDAMKRRNEQEQENPNVNQGG